MYMYIAPGALSESGEGASRERRTDMDSEREGNGHEIASAFEGYLKGHSDKRGGKAGSKYIHMCVYWVLCLVPSDRTLHHPAPRDQDEATSIK